MSVEAGTVGGVLARYGSVVVVAAEFVAVFVGVYLAGRLVLAVVKRVLLVLSVERTLGRAIQQLLYLLILVVGLSFAATVVELPRFVDVTGPLVAAVTLAIGFASRDVVSNLVSGVFIVTDPKFRIGDWIEWEGSTGVIEDITFRVTRVRTFDNELITVPNSQLVTTPVTNAVDQGTLRISAEFWIGYGDDVDEAMAILLEAAADNEEVLDTPAPTVRVIEVNDSRVGLQSRIWITEPARSDFMRVRSTYLRDVKARFRAAGISMPPAW